MEKEVVELIQPKQAGIINRIKYLFGKLNRELINWVTEERYNNRIALIAISINMMPPLASIIIAGTINPINIINILLAGFYIREIFDRRYNKREIRIIELEQMIDQQQDTLKNVAEFLDDSNPVFAKTLKTVGDIQKN